MIKVEITKYLANGLKYSEIARVLGMSKQLVHYYKSKLLKEEVKKL